ncbi:MAG: hypothetical protein KDD99_31170, partial [Bacteroidetes bacterium]|nr:hypothetical protein [Bacteroidota bacterium]
LNGSKFDSVLFNRSKLIFGNNQDPLYSNADWYYNDSTNILEIRLAWHLINVTDPSTGCVLDNVENTPEIECTNTPGIAVQAFIADNQNRELKRIPASAPFLHSWKQWTEPAFQERLKPLYDSLALCFKNAVLQPLTYEAVAQPEGNFEIRQFYKDYPQALSLRFEEGAYSQFEQALPLLNKYNLTATVNVDPTEIQQQPGYALTPSGQRLKRMGWEEMEALKANGNHITRNQASQGEFLVRASGYSADSLLRHLENENQSWVVLQYVDLTNQTLAESEQSGEDQITTREFEKHIRLMRNTNFWIASEKAVYQYQEEYAKAKIRVNAYGPFQFITIETPQLSPTFDHPLSFYFYTSAPKIEVVGSEDDGFYQNREGRVQLHAKPGREVTIKQIW